MKNLKIKITKSINKKLKKKGFTLVELIVVITILTILGTIAFISFQSYSINARNGARLADINMIQKNLGLYIIEKGTYPDPDSGFNITYKGGIAWTQGTVGDNVITNLRGLSKKPVDPLTGNEYTYSITNLKTEYQLGSVYEGGILLTNNYLVSQANAAAGYKKKGVAMVKGNYNGVVLKVNTGGIDYILAVPSIINAELYEMELAEVIDKKSLVFDKYENIPSSYNDVGYTMTGGFDYTPGVNLEIYSGSLFNLNSSGALKKELIEKLKETYSGTILTSNQIYLDLINIDSSNLNTVSLIANNYLQNGIKPNNAITGNGGGGSTPVNIILTEPNCASGYTYSSDLDKCESNITCTPGYAFNTTSDKCELAPTCTSGYTYNSSTKLCQKVETVAATIGTPTICKGKFTGSDDFGLLVGNNRECVAPAGGQCNYNTSRFAIIFNASCVIERWSRDANRRYKTISIGSSGLYTSTYNRREVVYNTTTLYPTCPSGYTLSGSTCSRTLTETPICPNSGVLNDSINMCQINPTCTAGGVLNSSIDMCQLDSTCSIGVLDYSLDACVGN